MRTPPIDGLETLTDGELAALRERFQRAGFTSEVLARAESVAPGPQDVVWPFSFQGRVANKWGWGAS